MKSQLMTWQSGQPDGAMLVLLHDRYGAGDGGIDPLAQALADTHQLIAVRSARTQSERASIKGYFWHLGPYDQPELSTLGDALYHLEGLLLELYKQSGRPLILFGRGEGGGVALLMGLLWRDIIAGVISVDGPLASNIDALPMELPAAAALPVLLVEENRSLTTSDTTLTARGAQTSIFPKANAADIAAWIGALG